MCKSRIVNRDGRSSPVAPGAARNRACDSFDRAYRLACELRQEQDAGVERARCSVGCGHHHRAGAAIALVTAFLGAGEPPLLAQPVKQRRGRGRIDIHRFPVQKKPDRHEISLPRYLYSGGSSGARCGVERGPKVVRPPPRKAGLRRYCKLSLASGRMALRLRPISVQSARLRFHRA